MIDLILLDDIYLMISEYNQKHSNTRYNIFKVLEITDREVLMCRVLADFLNPEGSHGKGSKYLKIFLKQILHRDDCETICNSAHVFKEYPTIEDRRIDIVIEAIDVFIPIEVKIHAEEQRAQCYDYYMFASRKDSETRVIYLTKWGTLPSRYSLFSVDGKDQISTEKIQCISFATDINRFMKLIIECEDDWIIREIAEQYMGAIKEFAVFADEELQMEVADKLCENEQNFRSMLVIEQTANKAKAKLIQSLFEEFETQFPSIQEKYGMEKESVFKWKYYKSQATEKYYAQSESTYPGINYVFSGISLHEGMELWFRIEADYNLFAGICLFDTKQKTTCAIKNQSSEAMEKAETALSSYLNLTKAQYEDWWVQFWYLPTAYDTTKLEGKKIPNFKDMNEAAIKLADKNTRQSFVKECLAVVDRELSRIILRR